MLVIFLITLSGLLVNLLLQLAAIGAGLRLAVPLWLRPRGLARDIALLGGVVSFLFVGHLLQIAFWALLFRQAGQFADYATAFYHSAVNYGSLGYGDIVMEGQWRLVGAIEACVGVMMFGVSTATIFAAMSQLFRRRMGGPPDAGR